MFFGAREEPHDYLPPPTEMELTGPLPFSFWLSILIPNIVFLISLILNLLCFVVMVIKSQCTFTTPLNLLIMVFLLSMSYFCLNHLVFSLLAEIIHCIGDFVTAFNQIGDTFSSYFSVFLLVLVGFNRAAVHTMPGVTKHFFQRPRLCGFIFFCAIILAFLSYYCYFECGMSRRMMSSGLYVDFVDSAAMMRICSYLAYAFAMATSLFYLRVYFFLKKQRASVCHSNTKALLDKAEIANSRMGVMILVVYSLSLAFFISVDNLMPHDEWRYLLHGIQDIVQALPSLSIPLTLIYYSKEMRGIIWNLLTGGKEGCKCKEGKFCEMEKPKGRRTTLSTISQ